MGLDKTLHHIRMVGGFNPSEKYESQLGLFFPIYGKIKFMFQTTNQFINQGGIPPVDLILWVPKPMSNSQ